MVDFFKNHVVYFDSLPKKQYYWEVSPQDRIFEFVCHLASEKNHKPFTPGIWKRFYAFDSQYFRINKQRDTVNCGVYTICNADIYVHQ